MYYSAVALLAMTVNLILNWRTLTASWNKADASDERLQVKMRYSHFLHATNLFYFAEIGWGIFYGHYENPKLFAIIYINTIFYFIFMLLTMLTWARYIVAYLDSNGRGGKIVTGIAWIAFAFGLICLMFNRFYHFIFSFNDAHEYIPESGRYITFIFLFLFYLLIAIRMLYTAKRSTGRQRVRCKAVAYTSIALGIFMFLQIWASFFPLYVIGLMLGTCVVHSFVEAGEKREKEIQDRISTVMAEDYIAIYYIDVISGEYLEYAGRQKEYMHMPSSGKDFFKAFKENIVRTAFPEDKEPAESSFDKETMLHNLEGRHSFSCKFRFMVGDEPRFFLITYTLAGEDTNHLILYEKDIEDELRAEKKRKESQKKTVTFTQIAESLASNYDEIYYVDIAEGSYVGYEFNNIYGQLEISDTGEDFYGESIINIPKIVHKQDREMMIEFLNKDNLISLLEDRKARSINYRIMVSGRSRYVRMTVRKTSDGTHFIIGVENIDAEIKREKQHLKALKTEKELARRDELTGTKNKTAYKELEASVQSNIDSDIDYLPFALIVCDANDLKKINDTQGHVAGDEYIKESAKLLCDIFKHSPVFRVGGDEFVVFLRGDDYARKQELMDRLRNQVIENKQSGNGAILASGIAEYDPKSDNLVSDILDRADKAMYENKQKLKDLG